jgi:hypothetical protein
LVVDRNPCDANRELGKFIEAEEEANHFAQLEVQNTAGINKLLRERIVIK